MYDTDIQMRTTLNLNDRLLRAAKVRAGETGQTLSRLIESALRDHLASATSERHEIRMRLLVKGGQPVPGVDVNDRDALYEKMEGRE